MRAWTIVCSVAPLIAGCGGKPCGDRLIDKSPSHDGKTAYIFVRDCGVTTGFSTNIAMSGPSRSLADATVVFTADGNHGKATAEGDAIWIRGTWVSPHRFAVRYATDSRIFKRVRQWNGVTIDYRAGDPYVPPSLAPPP